MTIHQKIDPASLAFDIDGVFADTMTLFLDIVREVHHRDGLNYEDITAYNLQKGLDLEEEIVGDALGRILDGNYAAPLRPMDGAVQVLTRLGKQRGSLLFVTARPHIGPLDLWMRQMLPGLYPDAVEVVLTGEVLERKIPALLDRGMSFFVEDRLETCFHLHDAGITPIVFKQPWNRSPHPFTEVESWKAIDSLIDWGQGLGSQG